MIKNFFVCVSKRARCKLKEAARETRYTFQGIISKKLFEIRLTRRFSYKGVTAVEQIQPRCPYGVYRLWEGRDTHSTGAWGFSYAKAYLPGKGKRWIERTRERERERRKRGRGEIWVALHRVCLENSVKFSAPAGRTPGHSPRSSSSYLFYLR